MPPDGSCVVSDAGAAASATLPVETKTFLLRPGAILSLSQLVPSVSRPSSGLTGETGSPQDTTALSLSHGRGFLCGPQPKGFITALVSR